MHALLALKNEIRPNESNSDLKMSHFAGLQCSKKTKKTPAPSSQYMLIGSAKCKACSDATVWSLYQIGSTAWHS